MQVLRRKLTEEQEGLSDVEIMPCVGARRLSRSEQHLESLTFCVADELQELSSRMRQRTAV